MAHVSHVFGLRNRPLYRLNKNKRLEYLKKKNLKERVWPHFKKTLDCEMLILLLVLLLY